MRQAGNSPMKCWRKSSVSGPTSLLWPPEMNPRGKFTRVPKESDSNKVLPSGSAKSPDALDTFTVADT